MRTKRLIENGVRGLRARLGETQAEFARRLGVSLPTVHRWETGKSRPDPRSARALALLAKSGGKGARYEAKPSEPVFASEGAGLQEQVHALSRRLALAEQEIAAVQLAKTSSAIRSAKPRNFSDIPGVAGEELDEIVRRIVWTAKPEKIVLFGSAARGTMGPDSDLDLMVVKRGAHKLHTAQAIHRALVGIRTPKDIIVAWPEELARFGRTPGLIYEHAMRDGRVLYEK